MKDINARDQISGRRHSEREKIPLKINQQVRPLEQLSKGMGEEIKETEVLKQLKELQQKKKKEKY